VLNEDVRELLAKNLARFLLQPSINGQENKLATLAAWFLCQSPAAMPQGHAQIKAALTKTGFELAEYGLGSDLKVDDLLYWLQFLGLIWQYERSKACGLVPDPSRFIGWHLDELAPVGTPVAVDDFCQRLAQICPVLDGGEVRRMVLERMSRHGCESPPPDYLSAALTFSLQRLQRQRLLQIYCPADQRRFLLLTGGEKIAFVQRNETLA
jgi:hypothetical protein